MTQAPFLRSIALSISLLFLPVSSYAYDTSIHGEAWQTPKDKDSVYLKSPESIGAASCFRKENDLDYLGDISLTSIDYCYYHNELIAIFYHAQGESKLMPAMLKMISQYSAGTYAQMSPVLAVTSWRTDSGTLASLQYDKVSEELEIMESKEALVQAAIKEQKKLNKKKK